MERTLEQLQESARIIGEINESYREKPLPIVTGHMVCSNEEFEHRCRVAIREESEKLSPDNALISLLCDGVRLAREYSEHMNRL